MKLDFCCICGKREGLHHHHIIPREHGGSDDETNLITLCYEHHAWIHSLKPTTWNNHSELVKEGHKKARAKGKHIGRPTRLHEGLENRVMEYLEMGIGIRRVACTLEIGVSTVYKVMEKHNYKQTPYLRNNLKKVRENV